MNLLEARSSGLRLWLRENDTIVRVAPIEKITDEVRAWLPLNKPEIIEQLKRERAEPPSYPVVGQELKKLLKTKRENCGCKAYARKMDRWGVAGCEERFDEITDHLAEQARKYIPLAGLAPQLVKRKASKAVRQAIESCRMSVVWVYWDGGARRDELRYSMRSAVDNLSDVKNIVLCGDCPGWYEGEFISSRRFGRAAAREEFGSGRFAKWIDSVIKLQAIIDDARVTDNFLWMYDDTFIVQSTTVGDLAQPRAGGELFAGDLEAKASRKWREVRRRTAKSLRDRGLPTRDYSTHWPAVYNK